jgi:hypothetical protein
MEKKWDINKMVKINIEEEIKSRRWFSLENYPYEIWKDVNGYESLYVVSNYGRVKRLPSIVNMKYGKRLCKGCIKSMHLQNTGYYLLDLYKNNKRKNLLLHRILAEAFLPNPLKLPVINHKDGDKMNNSIFINNDGSVNYEKTNLEWCTTKENVNHALYVLGHDGNRKGRSMRHTVPVCAIDDNDNVVMEFYCIMEAYRQTGICKTSITNCLSGRVKTAGGFRWKKYKKMVFSRLGCCK